MNLTKLGSLLTLQPLKGSRTQITAIVTGALNLLVANGYIQMTPEQQLNMNITLGTLIGFFYADKGAK